MTKTVGVREATDVDNGSSIQEPYVLLVESHCLNHVFSHPGCFELIVATAFDNREAPTIV
jgi:hypothetical protein